MTPKDFAWLTEGFLHDFRAAALERRFRDLLFDADEACAGFLSGRSTSSYEGTWVLSHHDSSAAPQTVQTASPVCGTKNFSSVRLYSAPQLH